LLSLSSSNHPLLRCVFFVSLDSDTSASDGSEQEASSEEETSSEEESEEESEDEVIMPTKKSSSKKKAKSKPPTRPPAPDVDGLSESLGNVNLDANPNFVSIQGQYAFMAVITQTPFVGNERRVYADIHVVPIHKSNFLRDVTPDGMSFTLRVLVPPSFTSRERIQAKLNLPAGSRDVMLTAFNSVAQDAATFFPDGRQEAPFPQV